MAARAGHPAGLHVHSIRRARKRAIAAVRNARKDYASIAANVPVSNETPSTKPSATRTPCWARPSASSLSNAWPWPARRVQIHRTSGLTKRGRRCDLRSLQYGASIQGVLPRMPAERAFRACEDSTASLHKLHDAALSGRASGGCRANEGGDGVRVWRKQAEWRSAFSAERAEREKAMICSSRG